MKYVALAIGILIFSQGAFAEKEALPGKTDPRIKVFTYSARDVFKVRAHYGYASHIIFGEDESIEHVAAGDSLAWHILPKQNHLFLKPIEDNAGTNLTVLTNKRAYNFILEAKKATGNDDKSLTFAISFRYPEEELQEALRLEKLAKAATDKEADKLDQEVVPNRAVSPDQWNMDYTRKGSETLAPIHIFDDGEFTYFQFPKEIDVPAIFIIDEEDQESLVNFHVKGKYIVVQRIARRFALRQGKKLTCIYNEAYKERLTPSALAEAK